jgi:hypothetical protein
VPDQLNPDPAFIQRNVMTLSQIGGIYDLLALAVEKDHKEILTEYRLATGAPDAVELLQRQGQTVTPNTPTNRTERRH